MEDNSQRTFGSRTPSTDDDATYDSLVHTVRKRRESSTSSSLPPPLPEKPPNFPYPSTSYTYSSGSHLIEKIDSSSADGAILMDSSNELYLALPSDSRFT